MKIITNKGIYIQKKDLELIFSITDKDKIPINIINKFQENVDKKDIDFIFFEDKNEICFLNNFWFVIDYNDIIDFNDLEIIDYYFSDLQKLRKMRVDYDKYKFLSEKKVYNSYIDLMLDEMRYFNYIPNKNEAKNYPLDFQLLYNKITDIFELNYFKSGTSGLEFPEEIFKPARYSKKQLQQIYYEVLSENLTFKELKPYEKQLYSIFSRINYTPDIKNIIRKIMLINRFNTVDFINDDLLDVLLRVEGKNSKFEESTMFLIDYLYVIGYNKFQDFESRTILEKDMRIIKKTINYLSGAKLDDRTIDKLSNYNNELANIIKTIKKCNYLSNNSRIVSDIFAHMLTYVYLNPNKINYDYKFLLKVYEYISSNASQILDNLDYKLERLEGYGEHFVDNFNKSNSLLLYLYSKKTKTNKEKNNYMLSEKNQTNMEK